MVYLEPFDPSRSFIASRWFRWNGLYIKPDTPFPPRGHEAEEHNLRVLYGSRHIRYGEPAPAPAPAGQPVPRVVEQSDDAKVATLVADNTHAQLLDMAADIEGVKKSDTKTEIATAIVKAGNGAP